MSPQKYEELKQVTANDEELQCIGYYIEKGWPDKKYQVQWNIRVYWPFRDELTCIDGIFYKGLKVIIPKKLRQEMLQIVHSTHQGIDSY